LLRREQLMPFRHSNTPVAAMREEQNAALGSSG
jgi:hypothetical protein